MSKFIELSSPNFINGGKYLLAISHIKEVGIDGDIFLVGGKIYSPKESYEEIKAMLMPSVEETMRQE